jgi:hypothetical protein
MTPLGLYQSINPDSSCTSYEVKGVCSKGGINVGYLINMFVPVAFVETVGKPGDSLLAVPNFSSLLASVAGIGLSVGQSNHSAMDNTFEAKVWTLPDTVMTLSPILPKCIVCMPSDAVDLVTAMPPPSTSGCEALDAVTARMASFLQGMPSIPFMPSLSYATEMDTVNWRTGCRDTSLTNLLQSNAFTCTAAAVAGQAGSVISKISGSNPLAKYFGNDSCIGTWGALFPRQMREVGNIAQIASAKTAYRALSVAKTQFGAVKFPVDLNGKLQQAYPAVSACFHPGDSPLPMVPLSAKPVVTSSDGAYGWIYWRPVTCCVSFTSLKKCALSHKN